MPRNKKEGLIFGICMATIMVYFMGLLNIAVNNGSLNMNVFLISIKAFPITFIIVFILEGLIVSKINQKLVNHFVSENDSKNAKILFNCFFIVTMMSITMTIIGGMLGGDNILTILSEFFARWPRNFVAAMLLNLLVAGPISRFILSKIQSKNNEDVCVVNA